MESDSKEGIILNRQDNVDVAGKKWEFDEDVAKCFPDMLKRSIPAYESMRSLVFSIGRNYVKKNTHICDIGCSDGQAIEPFIKHYGTNNYYELLDVSEPKEVPRAFSRLEENTNC